MSKVVRLYAVPRWVDVHRCDADVLGWVADVQGWLSRIFSWPMANDRFSR